MIFLFNRKEEIYSGVNFHEKSIYFHFLIQYCVQKSNNNRMRLKICTKFIQILIKKEMSQKFDNLQKINRLYKKTFGTNEQLRDPIVHIFSVS